MLVGVIAERTIETALRQMEDLKGKADVAEIRLDCVEEASWRRLPLLKEGAKLPLLFTFRKREQGGKRDIEEKKRLALYEEALALRPAFADIEADTDRGFVERIKKRDPELLLIGSFHDFQKTPPDLFAVLQGMHSPHFSFYKIAVHAHSTIDLLRLMSFASEMSGKIPLCCIAMGADGQPSRVLGPIVGSALQYSSLQDSFGPLYHVSLDTLQKVYHFSSLGKETKIYALLGDPVEASPGHLFHNALFHQEARRAVYIKLRLTPPELADFFLLAKKLPFGGFSVTMPLKEAVLPFLTQIDPDAKAIGAVNTIVAAEGDLIGYNTDGMGVIHALEANGHFVKGKKLAILGAGGSARSIAYVAMKRGAEVMVFNRSAPRAEKFAKDLGCLAYPLDTLPIHPYDVLINTIPSDPSGQMPILSQELLPSAVFMDINHPSLMSPLLRVAQERGMHWIDGLTMFEEQAILQQKRWFPKAP